MEATATLRHARISPQKLRLVADQIRGVPVEKAAETLQFSLKKAATIVGKVLHSAMANAENVHSADVSDLKVSSIIVNEGPSLKRIRPRAKGRANRIVKRTSHITIKVSDE